MRCLRGRTRTVDRVVEIVMVSLFLLAAGASHAAADTRTWNGADGGNWSVAANWLPVGTPQPTDDLVFPLALSGVAINANGATYTVNSITFEGIYIINGDGSIEVGAGGVTAAFTPGTFIFHVPVGLTADQVWSIDVPSAQIDDLNLGANQWTATIAAGTDLHLYVLIGSGAIVKTGAGLMQFKSISVHTGPITINDGRVRAENGAQLGDSDGTQAKGTTVNAPGVFEYAGTDSLPEALFLNGGGAVVLETMIVGLGPSVFTGGATLLSASGITAAPGEVIVFEQAIAGPGALEIVGATGVVLNAPAPSTFPAVQFSGNPGGVLRTESANQLSPSVNVILPANTTLDLNGHATELGGLNGTGTVALGNNNGAPPTLTINNAAPQASNFTGTISGVGHLHKRGTGELVLGGANTYTHETVVFAGSLRITQAQALAAMGATTATGTRVTGTGALVLDAVAPLSEFITLARTLPADTPTLRVTPGTPVTTNWNVNLGAGSIVSGGGDLTFGAPLTTTASVRFENVTARLAVTGNSTGGPLTLGAGGTLVVAANNSLTQQTPFVMDGGTLRVASNVLARPGSITGNGTLAIDTDGTMDLVIFNPAVFNGNVTGTGTLRKSANGDFTLAGATTFGGTFRVAGGRLILAHTQAVTTQPVIIQAGAAIAIAAPITLSGSLSMDGAGPNGAGGALQVIGGDLIVSGPVTLPSFFGVVVADASRTAKFQSPLSAPEFYTDGAGAIVFAAADNDIGLLYVGSLPTSTTTVRMGVSGALVADTIVLVKQAATFELNGTTQTIASMTESGQLKMGGGSLTFGKAADDNTILMTRASGAGTLTLNGKLVQTIGAHTFTGTLTINGNALLTGNIPAAGIVVNGADVKLQNGSVLGRLSVNGAQTVTAGAAQANGSVTLAGLTIPSGTTLKMFPAQANPPIKVNGAVSIAGPLDVTLTRATVVKGTPVVLIENDDTDPIVGQFAGLAEDELMPSPFGDLRISYRGSTGNDFTLLLAVLTYQLSEGATGTFFDTDLLIANPNDMFVPIEVTLLPETGAAKTLTYSLSPMTRLTVRIDEIEGFEATSFSTIVRPQIDRPLVVERTMQWDATGYGAHTEKATSGPQLRWYFAEGSQGFFSTFLLLANPQEEANAAKVTYYREDEQTVIRNYPLTPRSRKTVLAGDDPDLVNQSFGMIVEFTRPGVAERSMYFGTDPFWAGGHESAGVNSPSPNWYFAEGATGAGFDTFILVTNPFPAPNEVTFTFYAESGPPATLTRTIPGNSRITINPEAEDLSIPEGPVATQVQGFYQVIAERSQYWSLGAPGWIEAHNSFGVTLPALKWGLAEGRVGGPEEYQTYILLANTSTSDAEVTLTFLKEGTSPAPPPQTITVPAQTRMNVRVEPLGAAGDPATTFGTVIQSNVPIAVERSMYWNANGQIWSAGTNATATLVP
jgi:autotransporter-associated beta strand protein